MARASLTAVAGALVAVILALAGSAGAAVYKGDGDGVRVELEVRHGRIVFARVATTLRCVDGLGGRHRKALREYWTNRGDDSVPRDATGFTLSPIPLRGGGRFLYEEDFSEPDGTIQEIFAGVVRSGAVWGRFRYLSSYHETCGTGPYQDFGSGPRKLAKEVLHFRARRR